MIQCSPVIDIEGNKLKRNKYLYPLQAFFPKAINDLIHEMAGLLTYYLPNVFPSALWQTVTQGVLQETALA
jgi:hypothetical protein